MRAGEASKNLHANPLVVHLERVGVSKIANAKIVEQLFGEQPGDRGVSALSTEKVEEAKIVADLLHPTDEFAVTPAMLNPRFWNTHARNSSAAALTR